MQNQMNIRKTVFIRKKNIRQKRTIGRPRGSAGAGTGQEG